MLNTIVVALPPSCWNMINGVLLDIQAMFVHLLTHVVVVKVAKCRTNIGHVVYMLGLGRYAKLRERPLVWHPSD